MKFVQTLKNNPNLLKVMTFFKNPDITPESVVDAGKCFLVALYGYPISAPDTPSLNNVRYKCYMKSSFNKSGNMWLRFLQLTFPKSLPSDPTLAWQ
ncbi:hypothetical protein AVEN_266500-1 [Araneus ventricosus]|uniref:Uncharacterized protein n=1 Tax=Araneus ventricosus TaxID=182803 RepID=A0A4Y2I2U5_ARAVE|nr:hypothetical protein AVEN_266500-1 [Araneus ventricosus]